MSLIYRALKSLQASRSKGAPGTAGPHPEKRPRSRIQQLRHHFISPGVVMITAGLLILAGIGMVLGMEWLLERSRLVEPQVVSQWSVDDGDGPPREGAGDPSLNSGAPPPPVVRRDDPVPPPPPPFEAPPAPPPDRVGEAAATVAEASGRARPDAVPGDEPLFVPPAGTAAEVAFIAPPATDRQAPMPPPEVVTPSATAATVPQHTAAAAPAPADALHPLPEGGDTTPPDHAYRMARIPDEGSRPDASAQTPATGDPASPAGTASRHMPGVSLKVRRQAEYAVAARQLQSAMDAGNGPAVEELLLRLGGLQGEDNAYLLKMRAYWHLRNQHYELSEAILKELLERMPGDLDAQLNMAVVEAHTGRREAAGSRLAELARRFPGEARVASMARLLN